MNERMRGCLGVPRVSCLGSMWWAHWRGRGEPSWGPGLSAPRPCPAGLLLLVSVEVFRHSVRALLQTASPEPPPAPALTYEYSWSLGCCVGASLVLLLVGSCFLLLTLPPWPWGSLCPKQGHRAP